MLLLIVKHTWNVTVSFTVHFINKFIIIIYYFIYYTNATLPFVFTAFSAL